MCVVVDCRLCLSMDEKVGARGDRWMDCGSRAADARERDEEEGGNKPRRGGERGKRKEDSLSLFTGS